MDDPSYYHCQHCHEDVCIEIKCPCCGLGNPECQENACEVGEYELKRSMGDYQDDSQ